MTGLDKMKSQILNEAKAAADGKVAEAKRQAEEMINLAKEEAEKKRGKHFQKIGSRCAALSGTDGIVH